MAPRGVRIDEDSETQTFWEGLFQQMQLLGLKLDCDVGQPGCIATWASQVCHAPSPDGIAPGRNHDRHRTVDVFRCARDSVNSDAVLHYDYIEVMTGKLGGQRGQAGDFAVC